MNTDSTRSIVTYVVSISFFILTLLSFTGCTPTVKYVGTRDHRNASQPPQPYGQQKSYASGEMTFFYTVTHDESTNLYRVKGHAQPAFGFRNHEIVTTRANIQVVTDNYITANIRLHLMGSNTEELHFNKEFELLHEPDGFYFTWYVKYYE